MSNFTWSTTTWRYQCDDALLGLERCNLDGPFRKLCKSCRATAEKLYEARARRSDGTPPGLNRAGTPPKGDRRG